MSSFFESPASLRLRGIASYAADAFAQQKQAALGLSPPPPSAQLPVLLAAAANTTMDLLADPGAPHSSHPNFLYLAGLVCEAVLEVVFVALPGFLVAYTGMFDANSQKFVAELNTMVFTPCLIFTKLASQLNADKLAELAVIPVIFLAQTLVSWVCAQAMARAFGFGAKKRQKNFVLAMGVFGNSNSLPISLVLSLSKTISGLHWDKVPGDNDDEVAARGILYLLIFQQLGQLLRWTWGYSVLLKPAAAYEEDERLAAEAAAAEADDGSGRVAEEGRYRDDPDEDAAPPMNGHSKKAGGKHPDSGFGSGTQTPRSTSGSSVISTSSDGDYDDDDGDEDGAAVAGSDYTPPKTARSWNERARSTNHITVFPTYSRPSSQPSADLEAPRSWKTPFVSCAADLRRTAVRCRTTVATFSRNLFRRLPRPVQLVLSHIYRYTARFLAGVWRQMNPPLWAMLAALIVASVPALQHLFFDPGTLVSNSVTRAVQQSGGVAVPLILVVLGANLARTTLPSDQLASTPAERAEERRLLYASLLSRMVLPTIVMAPLLACAAKWVPVSILDDPIFIVVCFLLTGAPSALQLAQICQINGVFMGAMSSLLLASYVVAIFPSTLLLVLLALEVLEWAVI